MNMGEDFGGKPGRIPSSPFQDLDLKRTLSRCVAPSSLDPGYYIPRFWRFGRKPIMNVVLWIIQVLLALLFLFAGGTKLVMSIEAMRAMGSPNQILLPGLLIRFIGVCEVLGAL